MKPTTNNKKPDMTGPEIDMPKLARKVMALKKRPPCDGCEFMNRCLSGDRCLPFRQYIDSGRYLPHARRTPNLIVQLIQAVVSD